SSTIQVCVHQIKHLRVAHVCRAAAGLPPPSPLDDRRALISWERMVQREQETRTLGCVAWSLAVCAADRAKPVMDACLYICSNICGVQRLLLTHHRYAGPIRGGRHHAPAPQRGAMGIG